MEINVRLGADFYISIKYIYILGFKLALNNFSNNMQYFFMASFYDKIASISQINYLPIFILYKHFTKAYY